MPTSKTVKVVKGAGMRSGPMFYQRLASARMVAVTGSGPARTGAAKPTGSDFGRSVLGPNGGSMEGWRESRMRPKGGPTQTEARRVKR